jgi:DHA3 family macrolide efflux protein-like MFS transporter
MKKFLVLWCSQAVSMFGSSIVGFALAWYLAQKTGSATILSTALLVNIIPSIVLGPFIGPLIDRWDRKKIMIYSDLVTALLTLMLVVLFYTNTVQIWHIYVVMACRAISGVFQMPAFSASVPLIVPEKHLVRANGLNSTLNGIIFLAGPPAGAFLMSALPMQWVLSVDIITAVIAIGCVLLLAIPRPPRTTLEIKFNIIGDMMQGFRYVVSWRGLLFLLILCSMLNFFLMPLNSILPLFVTNYLGGDVLKLGWLQTAIGAGTITGGMLLNVWSGFKRRILTTLTALGIWSIALVLFSFVTDRYFYLGPVLMFFIGLSNSIFNAPIWAILHKTVPKDIQGRVFTMIGAFSGAMMIPGLAITGPVVGAIGLRLMYIIAGSAMFLIMLVGFTSRDLMNYENQKVGEKPAGEAPPPVT